MSETTSHPSRLQHTEAFSADGKNVHVIIETPQGKRNKYKGKPFNILGRDNAERAKQLVHEGMARLH